MRTEVLSLLNQLSFLAENCRDYDEMEREITALMNGEGQPLGELCLPLLTLLNRLKREKTAEKERRQVQMVKAVMNTLSYTELEVVLRIFEALDGSEGILIAGKIADSLGKTRSVVVNALRKLESARIIETRSLGVKGTYIKILNPLWTGELAKLRV